MISSLAEIQFQQTAKILKFAFLKIVHQSTIYYCFVSFTLVCCSKQPARSFLTINLRRNKKKRINNNWFKHEMIHVLHVDSMSTKNLTIEFYKFNLETDWKHSICEEEKTITVIPL